MAEYAFPCAMLFIVLAAAISGIVFSLVFSQANKHTFSSAAPMKFRADVFDRVIQIWNIREEKAKGIDLVSPRDIFQEVKVVMDEELTSE